MTPRGFEWRLRMHGTALGGWPTGVRSEAMALLHADDRARALLAAALDADDACDADEDALQRMRRRLHGQVALRARTVPALRWSMRGGAMAMCLAAGLWAGELMAQATPDAERYGHDPLATVQVAALEGVP